MAAILALAAVAGCAFLLDPGGLAQALGRDANFTERDLIWVDALRLLFMSPLLGHGYGAVWGQFAATPFHDLVSLSWAPHAHNGYLQLATELGLPAAVLAVAYLLGVTFRAMREFSHGSILGLFALAATVMCLFMNSAETWLFVPYEFYGSSTWRWLRRWRNAGTRQIPLQILPRRSDEPMPLLRHPGGRDPYRGPTANDEPSLREILAILHRRRRLIISTVLLLTGLCALVGFTRQPSYTATATLIVEPRGSKVVDLEAVVQRLSENAVSVDLLAASVQTHIGLIESDKILDRAVAQLRPEAVAAIVDGGGGRSWKMAADLLEAILPPAIAQHLPTQWLAATTGRAVEPDDVRDEGTPLSRTCTIDRLRRNLKLEQVGRSYILAVSYKAKRPEHASLVANAVAEAYVTSQLAEKRDLTERASVWLASEAEKLGVQVLVDEQAAEAYRAEQDLAVGPEDTPLDAQQLGTLTTELINARADVTSKEARLRRVQGMRAGGVAPETMADVLNAPLIATLREQELGLMREQAQLAEEYGSRHPRITLQEAERRRYSQRIPPRGRQCHRQSRQRSSGCAEPRGGDRG